MAIKRGVPTFHICHHDHAPLVFKQIYPFCVNNIVYQLFVLTVNSYWKCMINMLLKEIFLWHKIFCFCVEYYVCIFSVVQNILKIIQTTNLHACSAAFGPVCDLDRLGVMLMGWGRGYCVHVVVVSLKSMGIWSWLSWLYCIVNLGVDSTITNTNLK